ncbi:glucose-inhibited division protein B [Mesomycoplasma neurolyticum]|uniref:Ribosomal RNA small subunit methyltransferase G n=2 Tax=Mesomycoplasma neurolyticum TaxID=2120 RepID=A0A449A5Q3_9BACT|nr:glucose-inhibited division protein B [Mesomycoplasma neurolyticum]
MVDDNIFSKLEKYVELIEQENQKINLTGFSGDRLWEKGIYESLFLLSNIFQNENLKNKKMLDIGSGVGFPSIPFFIANNNFELTIYEPIQKRVNFLKMVANELNLKVNIKKIRAEDSKEEKRFDYITARAVSELKILIEISHFLGKKGGKFFFLKGPAIFDEIKRAEAELKIFKIKNYNSTKYISSSNETNYIFWFEKNSETPKGYPRKWAKIKKP